MIFIYFSKYINKMSTIDEAKTMIIKKKAEVEKRREREEARVKALKNPLSKKETEEFLSALVEADETEDQLVFIDVFAIDKYDDFMKWFNKNQNSYSISRTRTEHKPYRMGYNLCIFDDDDVFDEDEDD